MKSKFFKDTQGLESAFETPMPDKMIVCLRLSRRAYDLALRESAKQGLSSGEYIEWLIWQGRCQAAPSGLCTTGSSQPSIPSQRSQ